MVVPAPTCIDLGNVLSEGRQSQKKPEHALSTSMTQNVQQGKIYKALPWFPRLIRERRGDGQRVSALFIRWKNVLKLG